MVIFRVAKAEKYGLEGWVVERVEPGAPPKCVGLVYNNPVDALADANRLNSQQNPPPLNEDTDQVAT